MKPMEIVEGAPGSSVARLRHPTRRPAEHLRRNPLPEPTTPKPSFLLQHVEVIDHVRDSTVDHRVGHGGSTDSLTTDDARLLSLVARSARRPWHRGVACSPPGRCEPHGAASSPPVSSADRQGLQKRC